MIIGGLGAIPYYLSGSLTASPLFALYGLDVNWYLLAIMAGQFVSFIGVVVYNINQVSLRQAIVPIRLQGRMNATMRFVVWARYRSVLSPEDYSGPSSVCGMPSA